MAKIKESVIVECRGVDEYYELVEQYKKDGYIVEEPKESKCFDFKATRESTIWEI